MPGFSKGTPHVGSNPGDRYVDRTALSRMLAQQRVNNGSMAGGIAHAINQGLSGYLMGQNMKDRREAGENTAAANQALIQGATAQPWVNPDTGEVAPNQNPTGGNAGAIAALSQLNTPQGGNLARMLTMQNMAQQQKTQAQLAAEQRGLQQKKDFYLYQQDKKAPAAPRPGVDVPFSPEVAAQKESLGRAGAPSINVGGQGISKQTLGRYEDARGQLKDSTAALERLNRVEGIASQTKSGLGADTRLTMAKAMQAFGIKVDEAAIGNAELFNALQMDFVMDRIADTKGAISEKEMAAFASSVPSLSNTPGGNQLLIRTLQEVERRKAHLAQYEANLIRQNPGASIFDVDMAVDEEAARLSQAPLFNEQDQAIMVQRSASPVGGLPQYSPNQQPQAGAVHPGTGLTREELLNNPAYAERLRGLMGNQAQPEGQFRDFR